MAKEVSFYIKIDDRGTVKRVTADAEELGRAVRQVQDESERASREIFTWAQASQAVETLQSCVSELQGALSELTEAYQVQLVAETQLNTIMRQRMAATDAEIQSVKDLCSAQQELGVIGDEVQLSGAQQMATFLSEKQSLDVLIPAMNNLLAQQEGLKASTSGAVSIGNMMGKAMQGQVEVLQRVGITFSEAQKQVLQYGTESERAAMLAKVITENVGEMNAELAKTDAGRMQQMLNTIGDFKENVGAIVQGIMPMVSFTAQASTAVTGILKLTAAAKSAWQAFNLLDMSAKIYRTSLTSITAVVRVATAALRGEAVGATTAAVATRTLQAAVRGLLISSGVGIAVMALSEALGWLMERGIGAAQAMDTLSESEQQAAAAHRQEATDIARVKTEMQTALDRLRAFNGGREEEKKLVQELNQTYGQTLGYYSTSAQWYKALTANSAAYCEQMIREIRLRSLADRAAEIEQQRHDIVYDESGRRRRYSKQQEQGYVKTGEVTVGGVTREVKEWRSLAGTSDLEKAQDRLHRLGEEAKQVRAQMQKLFAQPSASFRHTEGWSATAPTAATTPGAITPKTTAATTTEKEALEGSIDYYEQQLRELRQRITATADEAAAAALQTQYDTLAEQLRQQKIRIGLLPPDPEQTAEVAKTATEQLREAYDKARQEASQIQSDYTAGIIDRQEADRQLSDLNERLAALRLKPIDVELDTTEARHALEDLSTGWNSVKTAASGLSSISEALSGQQTAWQRITGLVDGFLGAVQGISQVTSLFRSLTATQSAAETASAAATATQTGALAAQTAAAVPATAANKVLTASLMEVAAAQYFAAHASIPFAGFGIGAGFAASAKATVAAIGATPFANGGLIYGPTLALMGEYGSARRNPEVVAPLDRLRSLLADSVPGGTATAGGEWRVRGRDLVKVIANECRSTRRRTGLRG